MVLSSGSSCLDSQTILSGQIGAITDATTVSCKPYSTTETDHQCLLLANPYLNAVKVFDITDNQFVLSPIAYYPLAIKVGVSPGQIATVKGRIFTLDSVAKSINEIPASFISPLNNTETLIGISGNFFALLEDSQKQIWSFISSSDNNIKVQVLGQTTSIDLALTCSPKFMQLDPSNTYLVAACEDKLFIMPTQALLKQPIPDPLPVPGIAANIKSIALDSKLALLGLEDSTLIVVDLATQTLDSTAPAKLKANAKAVYIPSSLPGTPSTCCNGEKNWVGALLTDGTLQYWPYANKTFSDVKLSQITDLVLTTGTGSFTLTDPLKLIGAQVQNQNQDGLSCERRLFLIYSGAIFNTCEGTSNIKRVDQTE